MSRRTAQSVEEVLEWIETTRHHKAYLEWHPSDRKRAMKDVTHFVMEGYGARLRVPIAIHDQTHKLVKPGDHFDSRMYRATPAGKRRLTLWRRKQEESHDSTQLSGASTPPRSDQDRSVP